MIRSRTTSRKAPLPAALATLLMLSALAAPAPAAAQQHGQHAGHGGQSSDAASTSSAAAAAADAAGFDDGAMVGRAMEGVMHMGPHMRMTEPRPANEADRRRAAELVTTLRASLAKYKDVRAAEDDGFTMFAPRVKNQPVYHFTSGWRAMRSAVHFDPAEPASLLYKKNARGEFVLVGAMYMAPRGASEDELDRRVPLSVATWHRHVDICVPRLGERDRWRETEGGRMRFGPAGAIATRDACDAAGGRFLPQLFGWMVHANVFESDDPKVIWGDHR